MKAVRRPSICWPISTPTVWPSTAAVICGPPRRPALTARDGSSSPPTRTAMRYRVIIRLIPTITTWMAIPSSRSPAMYPRWRGLMRAGTAAFRRNVTGTYNGQPVATATSSFQNAPFKVQHTSFLYLVTSTDGGKSWSVPTLLPLKKDSERAYLVAPSKGLVTSRGEIVFPCYSFENYRRGSQPQHISFSTLGGRAECGERRGRRGWNLLRHLARPSVSGLRVGGGADRPLLRDDGHSFFARNNHTKRL